MDTKTLDLSSIFDTALQQSIPAEEYANLLQEYAQAGKTTGPKQEEAFINYTKLNAQRSKRVAKTVELIPQLVDRVNEIKEPQTWILITESWCGDAASSAPVIMKIAEQNENIDLQVVLRDSNLDLMDQFLTNGGRSIPKLIVTDKNKNVLFTWGPRPQEAQELYDNWRNQEDKPPYNEFQVTMQKWYNADKGQSLQKEILNLLV